MEDRPVIINIERMQQALQSETIEMPAGLTRDEMREFILKEAQRLKEKEQSEKGE